MTYIEYINQFWKISQTEQFSSNEAYLYFFILNEYNLRGWPNRLEYPNRRIVLATGLSEPTVIACRCRLQQKGLIQFDAGKRKAQSPVYYLNDLSKTFSNNFSITFSKPLSKTLSHNKDIRDKTKENIYNSDELFTHEEKPKKKSSPKKEKITFISPTLEEVKNYFNGKLPDWEQQANTFYNHFDSLGWRTASGAKIERWDSRANLWIIEKRQSNGNTRKCNEQNAPTKDAGIKAISFG